MRTEEFGDYKLYQNSAQGDQANGQQSLRFSGMTVGTMETL